MSKIKIPIDAKALRLYTLIFSHDNTYTVYQGVHATFEAAELHAKSLNPKQTTSTLFWHFFKTIDLILSQTNNLIPN
jgi:hypothetical protein